MRLGTRDEKNLPKDSKAKKVGKHQSKLSKLFSGIFSKLLRVLHKKKVFLIWIREKLLKLGL